MLARKPKSEDWVEPMPAKQFRKIEKAFKLHGGKFVMGKEADAILDMQEAEASTFNEYTILFRSKPSRAAVFEELIHTAQYREGRCDGSQDSRLQNEIEAKEKLIKYSTTYGLTEIEVENTKMMLSACKEELKRLRKEQL